MSTLGFKARVDPFACFLACVILRFTSGATPADCLQVSMAAKRFCSTYLQIMCPQAVVKVQGSNPWPSVPPQLWCLSLISHFKLSDVKYRPMNIWPQSKNVNYRLPWGRVQEFFPMDRKDRVRFGNCSRVAKKSSSSPEALYAKHKRQLPTSLMFGSLTRHQSENICPLIFLF